MSLGPHAIFIVSSYVLALAVVAALALWVIIDYRLQRRALTDLDARGVTRRSGTRRSDTRQWGT